MHSINHAIIHKLAKEKHGTATVVERDTDLPITEPVKKLVLDINELYASRACKGYGRFEADEIKYPSASILRTVFKDKTLAFSEGSKQLLKHLAIKANAAALATGGYVLMADVVDAADVNWFIIGMINNVGGSAIDDASLEIRDAIHIDLENLRVAGRVNITDWLADDPEKRYVGFLKQRGGIADYFKLFLGCMELIEAYKETQKVVESIQRFARDEGLEQEKKEEFIQSAYDYCSELIKKSEPLSLSAMSNSLWPSEPDKLQRAFVEGNVPISDGFVPDARKIKQFKRMIYKTKYWSLSLDRHALLSGDARYLPDKGQLLLLNLPDGLKSELEYEISDGN